MARDYYWEGVLKREVEWAKERRDLSIGASCFEGKPRRTLCSELTGDHTIISEEAFAEHGEFDPAEPEAGMDTGVFETDPHDPECHHINLENLAEEDFYPGREDDFNDKYSIVDEDPADIPDKAKAEAGVHLIEMLGLDINCNREVCDVVGVYLNEKMDGVVVHYFRNLRNPAIV